jgi:hypothetical protein
LQHKPTKRANNIATEYGSTDGPFTIFNWEEVKLASFHPKSYSFPQNQKSKQGNQQQNSLSSNHTTRKAPAADVYQSSDNPLKFPKRSELCKTYY